jgi:hypothetical protein
MRNNWILTGALALICLAVPSAAPAQNSPNPAQQPDTKADAKTDHATPPASTQKPDIAGVWALARMREGFVHPPFPLQPWAQEEYDAQRKVTGFNPGAICVPPGMPHVMQMPYPLEIVVTPGRVTILEEAYEEVRRIYTDGRPHPKDLNPTYNGDSIGHWEGDTLVVDTVGVKTGKDLTLDSTGLMHSDALHLVERIHRIEKDILADDMTIDDPKVFTKTFTGRLQYKLVPWELKEYVCEENNILPQQ